MSETVARNKESRFYLALLSFVLLSVPFDIFALVVIGDRGLKPLWGFGGILIGFFLVRILNGKTKIRIGPTGKAILFFNIVALLSLVNLLDFETKQLVNFVSVWVQLVFGSLLFFVITNARLNKPQFRRILQVWMALSFLVALYGLYQCLARIHNLPLARLPILNPSLGGGFTRGGSFGGFERPSSVFAEPGFLGTFLLPSVTLSTMFWFYRDRAGAFLYSSRALNLLVFLTILLAFVLCFSTGSYAAIAGTIAVAFLNKRLLKKIARVLILSIISLVVLGYLLTPVLEENFAKMTYVRVKTHAIEVTRPYRRAQLESEFSKTSTRPRYMRAKNAFFVWVDYPLTGVGMNNYREYYENFDDDGVHMSFIKVLAEMGIMGFVGLASIYLTALYLVRHAIRRQKQISFRWVTLTGFHYAVWAMFFRMVVGLNYLQGIFWVTLSLTCLSAHWCLTHPEPDADPVVTEGGGTSV